MKTRSAKAKGRRLTCWLREQLIQHFNLQPDDIITPPTSVPGEDLLLSPVARAKIPYSFECKNQEKLNIWAAIKQCIANSKGYIPVVVFSRNREEHYVVMRANDFFDLIK